MAQYVHQYVAELLKREHQLAQAYPEFIKTDPMYSTPGPYAMNLMTLILIGVVMKKISEVAPQVTDAVWLDALNHATDSSPELPWAPWVLNQDPGAMS